MTSAKILIPTLLLLPAAASSQQQITASVNTAFIAESYSFEEPFPYAKLTELSVPVGLDFRFGDRTQLSISTGWANIELTSQDAATLPDQTLSGVIDTEARLTVNVIPSRLSLIASGVVPTGIKTVAQDELTVLGAISSDIIGLTTNELGNGGNVGMGFVGAIPLGRFAIGYGATFRTAFSYQPVSGDVDQLRPGNEARLRLGFEGPVGLRSYLRLAGIYAIRQRDELGGEIQNGVGDRLVGYVSFNQAVGSSSLILYGFDVYRSGPRLEATPVGSQPLPKGNLFAAGVRWEFRVGSQGLVAPRAEFRNSDQASFENPTGPVGKGGRSVRGGADFRYQTSRNFAIVLQADGLTGYTVLQQVQYDLTGFKAGIHAEWRP